METIIDLLVNNGVAIAVVAFFMWKDLRFMDTIQKTLTSLDESTKLIEKYFIQEGKDNDVRRSETEGNSGVAGAGYSFSKNRTYTR